jgi:hypothetical protein
MMPGCTLIINFIVSSVDGFIFGLHCIYFTAADAELLVLLPDLVLLALNELPHLAGVPSPLEVQSQHHSVHEQHEADAEDQNEVGLADGEEGGCSVGHPRIGRQVRIGNPHIGNIESK